MTDLKGFLFSGKTLDDIDLPRIGHRIGIGEDLVHGLLDTETAGKKTDSKGRLPALYEPHVAWRNSSGAIRQKLVKAGLAYQKWGEKPYPKDSYPRIQKAMEIDERVALMATSWGGPQILGENYELAGFESPQAMVLAFMADEENQLEGMISFIENSHLDDELRVMQAKIDKGQKITGEDARPFVRGYNGPGYEKNKYHTNFATNVNKWIKIPDTPWSPDEVLAEDIYDGKVHDQIKEVQTLLDAKGYPEVGTIDGRWGTKTRGSVLAFKADNGLGSDWHIDESFLSALALSKGRAIAPARANATVADLRKEEGAEDIRQSDQTKLLGYATAGGGILTAATKATEQAEQYSDLAGRAMAVLEPIQGFIMDNLWLILLGIGGFVVYKSDILQKIRLTKHQTGEDVSV